MPRYQNVITPDLARGRGSDHARIEFITIEIMIDTRGPSRRSGKNRFHGYKKTRHGISGLKIPKSHTKPLIKVQKEKALNIDSVPVYRGLAGARRYSLLAWPSIA
jgi:hypothetical protein